MANTKKSQPSQESIKDTVLQELDKRLKRVDILCKIESNRTERQKRDLEMKMKILEMDKARKGVPSYSSELGELLAVARAWVIDNSKTIVNSEPAIVSLWTDKELEEIKQKILQKVKKL